MRGAISLSVYARIAAAGRYMSSARTTFNALLGHRREIAIIGVKIAASLAATRLPRPVMPRPSATRILSSGTSIFAADDEVEIALP